MNKWNLEGVAVDTADNMTVTGSVTAASFVGPIAGAVTGDVTGNVTGAVIFPTSDPLIIGAWWNSAGTLTISSAT